MELLRWLMETERFAPSKHRTRWKANVYTFDYRTKEITLVERMKLQPMTMDEAREFMRKKLIGRRDCCFKIGGGD